MICMTWQCMLKPLSSQTDKCRVGPQASFQTPFLLLASARRVCSPILHHISNGPATANDGGGDLSGLLIRVLIAAITWLVSGSTGDCPAPLSETWRITAGFTLHVLAVGVLAVRLENTPFSYFAQRHVHSSLSRLARLALKALPMRLGADARFPILGWPQTTHIVQVDNSLIEYMI